MIADTPLRDPEITRLIEQAVSMRATIVILSTRFKSGERMVVLGRIAALLRDNLAH